MLATNRCELDEPFVVQDIHVEGLWDIERLAGENRRFVFYTLWRGRPAGVVNLIAPRCAVPPALRMAAKEFCISMAGDVMLWRDLH